MRHASKSEHKNVINIVTEIMMIKIATKAPSPGARSKNAIFWLRKIEKHG
jgi:hypothetical protein